MAKAWALAIWLEFQEETSVWEVTEMVRVGRSARGGQGRAVDSGDVLTLPQPRASWRILLLFSESLSTGQSCGSQDSGPPVSPFSAAVTLKGTFKPQTEKGPTKV